LYGEGLGVRQDYATAMIWCRKAADQGLAPAQYTLGVAYRDGQGVRQNYAEAMTWIRKAADQGLMGAQRDLGYQYLVGRGTKQDYVEAMLWSRKAADQGDALAQNNIGVLYEHGLGVPQDYAEAMRWYRKAADQGNALAQKNAKMLEQKEEMTAVSTDGRSYTCLDKHGYRSVLTIDPVRRTVRITNYVRTETLVDGATGPISGNAHDKRLCRDQHRKARMAGLRLP
jgi:TPR repeat protein